MPAWPSRLTIFDEHREMLFWLLLLGSWHFLASPGKSTSVIGAAGTAWFVVLAWKSLGRLRGFGMHQARWEPAHTGDWIIAVATGFGAGGVIFGVAWASGQNVMLTADWRLVTLQVAPVRSFPHLEHVLSINRLECQSANSKSAGIL